MPEREGVGEVGEVGGIGERRKGYRGWVVVVELPHPPQRRIKCLWGVGNPDRIWFGRNIGVKEYCNYEMYLLRMGTCLWMGMEGDAQNTPE